MPKVRVWCDHHRINRSIHNVVHEWCTVPGRGRVRRVCRRCKLPSEPEPHRCSPPRGPERDRRSNVPVSRRVTLGSTTGRTPTERSNPPVHPQPPPYHPPGDQHLPPPPPGVPGRDTPPPYTPPTAAPSWGAPTPTPTFTVHPKRNLAPLILGALAVLLTGAILGALVRGGNDPADTATPAPSPPPTTAATTYEATTTSVTIDRTTDRELQELALDSTWDDTSYSDQRSICEGVELLGVEYAAELLNDGADGVFDIDLVEDKLVEWCGRY